MLAQVRPNRYREVIDLQQIGGGAGYGDRTLLTRVSKLVMARDFWRQGFDAQTLDSSRPFTGIHSNPLDSTDVLETFWTRLQRLRRFASVDTQIQPLIDTANPAIN